MQSRAAPQAPHAIPKRASSRQRSAALSPFASGSRALSGTLTSANVELRRARCAQRELVLDDARLEPARPLLDEERLDAVVGHRPYDGDVRQRAVRDPLLRAVERPVAAASARVRAHARRDPSRRAPRSTRSNRASSPRASSGSHRDRCSSEPNAKIAAHDETALHGHAAAHAAVAALELLADEPVRGVAQARRNRSRAASRRTVRARRAAATSSTGKRSAAKQSAMIGVTSRSTNRATVSRIRRSSSLSSALMSKKSSGSGGLM